MGKTQCAKLKSDVPVPSQPEQGEETHGDTPALVLCFQAYHPVWLMLTLTLIHLGFLKNILPAFTA